MTPYRGLIQSFANQYRLDPNLVEAVVIAESNGCTDAFRYEPEFYQRYLKDNPEYRGMLPRRVSSSYGLMQVMYSTAREHGFRDLPEVLFQPNVGLQYGCLHLAKVIQQANGNVREALARYNGGGNYQGTQPQKYATRVLTLYRSVEMAHPKDAIA